MLPPMFRLTGECSCNSGPTVKLRPTMTISAKLGMTKSGNLAVASPVPP